MFTLFKKLKARARGGAGLRGVTYRVYTASGKPRRGQMILHASGAACWSHPSASQRGNSGKRPRAPSTAKPPTPREIRRGAPRRQSLHHNAAETAAATGAETKTRSAAPTTASRRLQNAAVKPSTSHGATAARSKTTSRTTLANAATRANTAPTTVETEKLKPSREVCRRIPKRDGSLRTGHLKRNPHHQVKHWNQRPPAPHPKDAAHKPNPKHSRQPPRRPPAPHLTTDPNDSHSPTDPSQTASLSTRRGGHSTLLPNKTITTREPPQAPPPPPSCPPQRPQAKTRPQKRAQRHSRPRISLRFATPAWKDPATEDVVIATRSPPVLAKFTSTPRSPTAIGVKKHAAANTSQRPHKPHQKPQNKKQHTTAAAPLRRPTLAPPHPSQPAPQKEHV